MNNNGKIEVRLDDIMPILKEALEAGKSAQFIPYGTSMLPMLRPGRDRVIISPLPEKLKKYDIVLYQRESGEYILHRINVVGDTYICLGDNQFRYETGIRQEQIIGIVTAFFRDGKKYSVQSFKYWLYCRIWPTRRRFRYAWLKFRDFVQKILKKRRYEDNGRNIGKSDEVF